MDAGSPCLNAPVELTEADALVAKALKPSTSYSERRLLLAQANEVREFGPLKAHLRSRVLSWLRRVEAAPFSAVKRLPYGIVFRIHNALEPKPLYATKRSICWGRYVEAERRVGL